MGRGRGLGVGGGSLTLAWDGAGVWHGAGIGRGQEHGRGLAGAWEWEEAVATREEGTVAWEET